MATDRDDPDFEPAHTLSSTDHLLTELQLYGHRPLQDEPDPRPLPEANAIGGAVADIFDVLIATLRDTRLEPDLEDLLWSTVNLFHRAGDRVQRELDDNEDAQKRSQKEQDGSEIRSVELERLVAEGLTLIEPKRRAETEVLLPAGPKIAFTGGLDFNDYAAIWDTLDKVCAKHPDMVLLHGGSPKGAERIAACWADNRKVPQVVFRPDWNRHARAAPFKRNDRILDVLPIGVIVFPGSGISANLADKAKKLGIPVCKYGGA